MERLFKTLDCTLNPWRIRWILLLLHPPFFAQPRFLRYLCTRSLCIKFCTHQLCTYLYIRQGMSCFVYFFTLLLPSTELTPCNHQTNTAIIEYLEHHIILTTCIGRSRYDIHFRPLSVLNRFESSVLFLFIISSAFNFLQEQFDNFY